MYRNFEFRVDTNMRDIDVRTAVHEKVLKKYHLDSKTVVVDELCLNSGATRIDIAVINGVLHGFELKSKKDNLLRLPAQVSHYSSVLDKVTLVVDESHLKKSIDIIPAWWGVKMVATNSQGNIKITNIRRAFANPDVDSSALIKLLWKDECLVLLDKLNMSKGNRAKSRFELWDIISSNASLSFIKREVKHCLKQRKEWRAMA